MQGRGGSENKRGRRGRIEGGAEMEEGGWGQSGKLGRRNWRWRLSQLLTTLCQLHLLLTTQLCLLSVSPTSSSPLKSACSVLAPLPFHHSDQLVQFQLHSPHHIAQLVQCYLHLLLTTQLSLFSDIPISSPFSSACSVLAPLPPHHIAQPIEFQPHFLLSTWLILFSFCSTSSSTLSSACSVLAPFPPHHFAQLVQFQFHFLLTTQLSLFSVSSTSSSTLGSSCSVFALLSPQHLAQLVKFQLHSLLTTTLRLFSAVLAPSLESSLDHISSQPIFLKDISSCNSSYIFVSM